MSCEYDNLETSADFCNMQYLSPTHSFRWIDNESKDSYQLNNLGIYWNYIFSGIKKKAVGFKKIKK